jgi:hypothetical protein
MKKLFKVIKYFEEEYWTNEKISFQLGTDSICREVGEIRY